MKFRIKSLCYVAIGITAILFVAWMIQLLGLITNSVSPTAYSNLMDVWNSTHKTHSQPLTYSRGLISNFMVGFSLIIIGLMVHGVVFTLFPLFESAGRGVVSMLPRLGAKNDVA